MYYLITKPKFILCSVSNGWLFWSVNHTSKYENSELNVFKNMKFVGEVLIIGQILYLEQICIQNSYFFLNFLIIVVDNVTMN